MDVNEQVNQRAIELLSRLGFEKPTAIQEQALPVLARGDSLLGLSPTGSGKTLAFVLPLLCRLEPSLKKVQLIVLTPTRELGLQVAQVSEQSAQHLARMQSAEHLTIRTAFGGQSVSSQKAEIEKNPTVLVATPGRLLDYLERGIIELDALKAIVLDEADLMVGMGFEGQVSRICDFLPRKFQAALFSATENDAQTRLQNRLAHRAVRLDVRPKKDASVLADASSASLKHEFWLVREQVEKSSALVELLKSIALQVESGIIFCQTREGAQKVGHALRDAGISAETLSGELGQVERTTVLRRFKSGGVRYLVATNLASRGIDIKELSVVVHFDLPSTLDEYIHRSGRSGRAGSQGWSISLCTPRSLTFLRETLAPSQISLRECAKYPLTGEHQTDKELIQTVVPLQNCAQIKFKKLHLNKGKSSKIRPGDVLGALTKSLGLEKNQVGGIYIFDHFSHVEIDEQSARKAFASLGSFKIKNIPVRVSEAGTLSGPRG